MNIPKHLSVVTIAFSLCGLAACGGGGGGGGGGADSDRPMAVAPSMTMSPPEATKPSKTAKAVSSSAEETPRQTARTAVFGLLSGAGAKFGSVAISTGNNVSSVSTAFNGQRAAAKIGRTGTRAVLLDTDDAVSDTGIGASLVGLPGRSGRTRYVYSQTSASSTFGLLATDWSNTDPTDYLAGGYWLEIKGSPLAVEIGAFVDGPELSLVNPPTLPISGTASYAGSAAGMYAVLYGTDFSVPAGSGEFGEFLGTATLNADFSAGTIGGCIGCRGDVFLTGSYENSVTGETREFGGVPTDYEVHLGRRHSTGALAHFQGSNVALSSPTVAITETSGYWAGKFSNKLNENDNPRLAAGTFGGEGATAGGTKALFVGAFAAGN